MGIVGVDLWLYMGVMEPQCMSVQFFAWRFSAGDGRCGFTGRMQLVHLVWGLLLHGIGTFVGVIHGIYVTRCDYLHRLGWAA